VSVALLTVTERKRASHLERDINLAPQMPGQNKKPPRDET